MAERFREALEAFAVGDALGMPTEFLTREDIREKIGFVEGLLDPSSVSSIHGNLRRGKVTDDTEQVLYLIRAYAREGKVTPEATIKGLLEWIKETEADKKGYVGPSTLKALQRIKAGKSYTEEAPKATTCGAAMRVLAASLFVERGDVDALKKAVWACTVVTHKTSIALEAAMALGFGYHFAAMGASFGEIVEAIVEGAKIGRKMLRDRLVGASTGERVRYAVKEVERMRSREEVLDFIYYVVGTGMGANEVVPSAVALFSYAREDVWLAVRMGASVGGDTDTIAAISGALCCLYAGGHNIPREVVGEVLRVNGLELSAFSEKLHARFFGSSL